MSLRSSLGDISEGRSTYDFVGFRWRWWALSLLLIAVSVVSLSTRGLNLGIDFEGGTAFLVKTESVSPSVGAVRDVLEPLGLSDAKVSILGDDTVRVQTEELEPGVTVVVVTVDDAGPSVDEVDDALSGVGVDVSAEAGDDTVVVRSSRELDEATTEVVADALAGLEMVEPAEVDVSTEAGEVTEVAQALADYAGVEASEVSISEVGPTFGKQVAEKARNALLLFFGVVALYLTLRFKGSWKMAVAALVAAAHDIVITVGVYSVSGFEVTPATVIAFLTILGFSLYDTVVVFDKIAENSEGMGTVGHDTYSDVVNRSMNQVLMRSISTSFVAILPVVSLLVMGTYVFGAPTLRDFALALLVGLVAGTYSSIFIATPILAVWREREPRFRALRERVESRVISRRDEESVEELEPIEADVEPSTATTRTVAKRAGESPIIAPRARKQRGKRRR